MRQPAVPCTYPPGYCDCLLYAEMRDVPAASYTIDYEMVKPPQLPEFFLRNHIHVSAIGNVPEAEAKDRKFVMHTSYRDDADDPWLFR